MAQPSGTQRYRAGSELVRRAQQSPARVYRHFDDVAALLDAESNIIKWCALRAIAALAPADSDGKIALLLDRYLSYIRCGKLVTAVNAIAGAGLIARAQPDLGGRIAMALLEVGKLSFGTPECRNVAIGHSLDALAALPDALCMRNDVLAFVRRQEANTRAPVARRARAILVGFAK